MREFLGLALLILFAWWTLTNAKAQEAGDYPGCAGWIPHQCSCTSHSCYEASPGELIDLGNGKFRVSATGEVVSRTDWSKDGRFMICAYQRDHILNRWATGPGNPVTCVFPPPPTG